MNKFSHMKWIIGLGLLLLSQSLSAPSGLKELELGSPAPLTDISMKDISGKDISLKGATDKNGLLVIFSCNTCPWVVAWQDRYPGIAAMAKKAGVGTIFLNSNEARRDGGESLEDMKKHAADNGYLDKKGSPLFYYAVDKDHKLADAFGAGRTPQVFLFNGENKLIYKGAIDDNAKKPKEVKVKFLENAMTALTAGKKVEEASTKSIGCTIKRVSK